MHADRCDANQLIFPTKASAMCANAPAARLYHSPQDCAKAREIQDGVAVGLVLTCLQGPAQVSAQQPRPTQALIAAHKEPLKNDAAAHADFIYLRASDTFASLRSAVLAATDVTNRPLMAEMKVDADGRLAFGTDIVAAVGVLQRIGVSTVVLKTDTWQALCAVLTKCAPYARISLGACIKQEWLGEEDFVLPNAELLLAYDAHDCGAWLQNHAAMQPMQHVPRDHDDFLLAPDGTNAHFLDPYVHISDEIVVSGHLGEHLLEAEEGAGALKLQFNDEEDLTAFEEQVFMIARPVCLCAQQPELLEEALRIYPGRALYDGTWPLEERLAKYFEMKYGMIIL